MQHVLSMIIGVIIGVLMMCKLTLSSMSYV